MHGAMEQGVDGLVLKVTESDVDGDEPIVVVGVEYVMLEVVDDML